MLKMREEGLSNADIANCLEISAQTVYRYIGAQGKRMDTLAAFAKPKAEPDEQRATEAPKPSPRAVDTLELAFESVKSAEGSFRADLDYEDKCLSLFGSTISFDKLPELVTFVVGLTGRVNNH